MEGFKRNLNKMPKMKVQNNNKSVDESFQALGKLKI